jgi:endonuclease YncB( thermonuclease family)
MDLLIGYMVEAVRSVFLLLLAVVSPQFFSPWNGQVVEVIRADEIKVSSRDRVANVRLYGIDSPIWWHTSGNVRPRISSLRRPGTLPAQKVHLRVPVPQRFGDVATEYMRKRTLGKAVVVQPVPSGIEGPWYHPRLRTFDSSHRVQALVWIWGEDQESLNKELLSKGLAWWYRPYVPFEIGFKRIEEQARKARVGLWRDTQPLPPWIWQGKSLVKTIPDKGFPRATFRQSENCPPNAPVLRITCLAE